MSRPSRDDFALAAMQALIPTYVPSKAHSGNWEACVAAAYRFADGMVAEQAAQDGRDEAAVAANLDDYLVEQRSRL